MFFRKPKPAHQPTAESSDSPRAIPAAITGAETAHLRGPGCLRVASALLRWEPVDGRALVLHPKRLGRVFLYGAADVTGTAVRLLWRHAIQIIFLTPQGHEILGKIQPQKETSQLTWLQHRAALDPSFSLRLSKEVVGQKIASTIGTARYYQRQGKSTGIGELLRKLDGLSSSVSRQTSVASLRGIEGTAACAWFDMFRQLLPDGWTFPGRRARPATDSVNSLLSLDYTFLVSRCQVMLSANDLDPMTGFLHERRSGRPSLACDLMEPYRISVIDRLVLGLLSSRRITHDAFQNDAAGIRLKPEAFRLYLNAFETEFSIAASDSPSERIQRQINDWIRQFRNAAPNELTD